MDDMIVIKTSESDWFERALKAYTQKKSFELIDDAHVGLTTNDAKSAANLIRGVNKRGAVSWQQIAAVLVGLGITSAGLWIIAAAIADPEPTTKLTLLISGGIILALTGSLATLKALGMTFIVSVKNGTNHFQITPQ